MPLFGIAGFYIELFPKYTILTHQAEPFRIQNRRPADFSVVLEDSFLQIQKEQHPEADDETLEYVFTGSRFAKEILRYDAIVLHASAVVLDSRTYLFSADSGTGKTTHTQLWIKRFGAERAHILNDDAPVVRRFPDGFRACGSPFAGSTGWSRNEQVPIAGICFLERAEENRIRRINASEALPLLLKQTPRARDGELVDRQFATLDRLFREVPMYRMKCDMSQQAVKCAYQAIGGTEE